ncbi:MAG: hypothetical protein OXR68_02945, partial [Alphaproteobacteria bacterium]|nr:hypothetical protein [Alphaproteobacteria bacterium]
LIIYQGYQFFLSAKVDGYGNYVNEKNNLIKLVDLALASPIHRDTLADCREGDHASPWLKDKDRYSYIVQLCNNYASFVSSSASRGNSEQQKERERQKLILVNIRKKLKSEKVNAFLSHVLLDFYFPLCWALLAMGVVLRLGFKLL